MKKRQKVLQEVFKVLPESVILGRIYADVTECLQGFNVDHITRVWGLSAWRSRFTVRLG